MSVLADLQDALAKLTASVDAVVAKDSDDTSRLTALKQQVYDMQSKLDAVVPPAPAPEPVAEPVAETAAPAA
jgi:hypothetical protein